MILVDGISGALFYAFDKVADKTLCFHTLSREFSLEELKSSRSNFFQAFNCRIQREISKKNERYLPFLRSREKISKIDKAGHGNCVTVPL